jgi:NAD(P)-dependent dehydrogenase (short-subunit alcohol dehydrogenase family)
MTGSLDGKVAVITGGTRGIGLAIAEALAGEGARIAISSRSAESVRQATERLRQVTNEVIGAVCNIQSMTEVEALARTAIDHHGKIDIWVNNAGISGPYGPTIDIAPDRFIEVVNTNIIGVYNGSLVAVLHFRSRAAGKLINVVGRGARGPVPFQNAYASSKAWVRSFTLALAEELKGSRIGVYVLSPGMVQTEMLQRPEVVEGYEDRLGDRYQMILRMWSGPADRAAQAAVWLAGPATDGKTAIDRRLFTRSRLIAGILGELSRRLLGRQGRLIEVKPRIIPAWKPPSSMRS